MTTDTDKTLQLKRALQAIKDLRARLEGIENSRREPVAVIGMACRFPGGANTPEAYWDVLKNKVDGIVPVPVDRWNVDLLFNEDTDAPGKVNTRWGGFLPQLDQFDAAFFGISPREAAHMDPQQRLMLEVAYEAFEDAGLPLENLGGSRTGVFVGVHSHSSDYYLMQVQDQDDIDIYTGTGTSHSVVSGRISYLYDLQGPNIALDTACSSSLVAVHLATQSLRNGECDLAMAGGVNVMLTPEFTMVSSRMRMMAPDGRCKAFDARADGFVRSEGCGAVILKRLSDALRDGDPILALIRGSAINQDGHSNGLTAPNGLSQQAVIRKALENSGVRPEQVSYVETHGTGTPLGDPIEIEALSAIYGQPRPDGNPLVVGSAKSNVGHTEGAAGVAGLIKTVLSLQHQTIPSNLHFEKLNPHISLEGTRLEIAAAERAWGVQEEQRIAAVSAFGWSGTNAHVVLEEAPQSSAPGTSPSADQTVSAPLILPISARSPEALQDLAAAYHQQIATNGVSLTDLTFTAATRRSQHPHRIAVLGANAPEMLEALEAFRRGESHARLATGEAQENHQPGIVFVFPGQGGQWLGMGRQLLRHDPAFRAVIERCEDAFRPLVNWSLLEQLNSEAQASRIEEIDVVQPVLFAIQIALAASLRARGVVPDAVVGHSLGEVAAAYVAGALTLEDAALVICTRSRLMRRVSGQGAMAVIGYTREKTDALLAQYRDLLSVAVSNSPSSTVISGDPRAVDEVLTGLRKENIFCRAVNVDVAAHSPQMEALRPELVSALANIRPQAETIPLYSTVEGRKVNGKTLDAQYWGRNLRQPVLFSAAVQQLIADGYSAWVECGPHPVLLSAVGQNSHAGQPHTLLAAMRREEDEIVALQAVLAGLYCAGYAPDWKLVNPTGGRHVTLPGYPWQRKRYWVKTRSAVDPLANWFYQVDWKPQPQTAPQTSSPGRWLVFCKPQTEGTLIADALAARGAAVIRVWPGDEFCQVNREEFTLDPYTPEHFQRLISAAVGQPAQLNGVAFCWGLDAPQTSGLDIDRLAQIQHLQMSAALSLTQALATARWQPQSNPRLWIITRGAQPVAGSRPSGLAQSPLWGFGRVVAFEHPEVWGGLVDMDAESVTAAASELLGPADQQTGFRQGQRFQAQLTRQVVAPVDQTALTFPADASYLVTGGLGGLGLKVAAWLIAHGARHIALMGRSRGTEAARQAAQELEASGAQIVLVQGDSSHAEDVRRVLAEMARSLPPLRGIIHSAGTVEDAVLMRQDWPAIERVFASKVLGAWNLHQLTQEYALDHFVLFSSAASLLGTPGQSNYAAANAFLDALAYERQAAGLPVLVVNWGAWGEVGLAAKLERPASLSHLGIESFSPQTGVLALERAFLAGVPQLAVASIDWSKFVANRPGGATSPYLARLVPAANVSAPAEQDSSTVLTLPNQVEAAAPETRLALLTDYVTGVVTNVLRYDQEQTIHPDKGFFQMGMDSLMAVELKNRLQKSMGRSLRTTLAFDYPSINLLSAYLLAELYPQQPPAPPEKAPEEHQEALDEISRDELKNMLDEELRGLEEDL